jgi:hypothetical protein
MVQLEAIVGPINCTLAEHTLEHAREHDIKAAFLYNFVRFSDWPQEKFDDSNTIVIGLLGEQGLQDVFQPVKDKPIQGRKLIIKEFGGFGALRKSGGSSPGQPSEDIKALRKCHLLFVCKAEDEHLKEITEAVKDCNVLTIGETENFLDAGGIIRFIKEGEKVAFGVNLIAAKKAGIQVSSQVLRLAKRVITEETADDKNK